MLVHRQCAEVEKLVRKGRSVSRGIAVVCEWRRVGGMEVFTNVIHLFFGLPPGLWISVSFSLLCKGRGGKVLGRRMERCDVPSFAPLRFQVQSSSKKAPTSSTRPSSLSKVSLLTSPSRTAVVLPTPSSLFR